MELNMIHDYDKSTKNDSDTIWSFCPVCMTRTNHRKDNNEKGNLICLSEYHDQNAMLFNNTSATVTIGAT